MTTTHHHSKKSLDDLRQLIHQHNHDYHVLNRPTITDEQYDILFRELKALEEACPELADPNSPTVRVGGASIDSFEKVKHAKPMLSLENTFTAEEVVQYFGGKVPHAGPLTGLMEPKVDGLSMSLRYEDGRLVQAVTRGDGTTGDDVTRNVRTIATVPLVLQSTFTGEVRGEVYMPRSQFVALNKQLEKSGDELFANPRNAASGSIKRKNPAEVAARKLAFVAYSGSCKADTQEGLLVALAGLGFLTPASTTVDLRSVSDVDSHINSFRSRASNLEFDTDGLVFKINSLSVQKELGHGTRAPHWATSYKFPPEQKTTTLLGITVQVGRLGTLTPVAELKPVSLAGTVVRRATLHNQDEIDRLAVDIGDEVVIQKAAEIIPQVVAVSKKKTTSTWKMPKSCPCCGANVTRVQDKVATMCPAHDTCADQVYARLEHAVKKQSLDIDGCGEKTIRALMAKGVARLSDLFALKDLSFLGDSMSQRLSKAVNEAKKAPLWRKLHALGIEGIGVTTCKELSQRWPSLADMLDNMSDVAKILGPITFKNFQEFLDNESNFAEIEKLILLGVEFSEDRVVGQLTGKVFVITGGMVSGSREDVSAKIESQGGVVKSSVSKAVHYLVVGDGAGANKSAAAAKLGTKCISEADLYSMMGLKFEKIEGDLDDVLNEPLA